MSRQKYQKSEASSSKGIGYKGTQRENLYLSGESNFSPKFQTLFFNFIPMSYYKFFDVEKFEERSHIVHCFLFFRSQQRFWIVTASYSIEQWSKFQRMQKEFP